MNTILPETSRNCQVKDYITDHFSQEPEFISEARLRSKQSGLKEIHVPENVGKTLKLISCLIGPKKILEVGTLGGYSTLWLAEGLSEEGKIITLEYHESHAKVARENFNYAGLSNRIEVRVGLAIDLLRQLILKKEGPFDLIFLDADKETYPDYLEPLIELSRPGTVILSDNLIPKRGELGVPDPSDIEAVGIYTFNQKIAHHPRLDSLILPTIVGEKGRIDGLGISLVK